MALQPAPRKEPRPIPVSIRLSRTTVQYLKEMGKSYNLSQADIIEQLINDEWKRALKKKMVIPLHKRPFPPRE